MSRWLVRLLCFKEHFDIEGKRYIVRETLGEGGFSTVHLVSETGSGRLFALKKIRCHSAEDEKKALDEITYHRQIQHPSIIQCLGSVTIGRADISNNQTSLVLLLLPFYKLGTLQNLLETRQRTKDHLEENLVLDYFHKTCEGVQAIHKNGTAHRDLKPANVLLSSNNCIVIMDFGLTFFTFSNVKEILNLVFV